MKTPVYKSVLSGVICTLVISALGACGMNKAEVVDPEAEDVVVDQGGSGPGAAVPSGPPRDTLSPNSTVIEVYKFLALRDPQILQTFPNAFNGAQTVDQLFAVPSWNPSSGPSLAIPSIKFEINMADVRGSSWGGNEAGAGSNVRLWFEVARPVPERSYKMYLKNSLIREVQLTEMGQGQFKLHAIFGGPGYSLEINADTAVRAYLATAFRLIGTVKFAYTNGVSMNTNGNLGSFDVAACPVFAASPEAATKMRCF